MKRVKNILSQNRESRGINVIVLFSIAFLIILIIKDIPYFRFITLYVTSIHEVFHAIVAILTGGEVKEINLHNMGGFVQSIGGNKILIGYAGYIGTALVGAIMLYVSHSEKLTDIYFIIFSILVILLNLIYINSYFNIYFYSSIIISLLILLSIKLHFTRYISIILSAVFISDSFSDAKIYLFGSLIYDKEIVTDSDIIAKYLGFEWLSVPISISFLTINLLIYFLVFYLLIKKNKLQIDEK